MMTNKLGLSLHDPDQDDELFADLLALLQSVETDMTIFFRQLAEVDLGKGNLENIDVEMLIQPLDDAYYVPEQKTVAYVANLLDWLKRYNQRILLESIPQEIRHERMNRVNPKYVLRNYLAQLAIDKAEQGDFAMISELLELLRHPYDEQPEKAAYSEKRPDWARHRAGCSMLSCSS
jgi:serine/tyrosine/threonine adenylyltransferase